MATIKLGIHEDYVPSWGVWEGVRDLVQNALDEDDKGNELVVTQLPKSDRVVLSNVGGEIPTQALAVGFSTKANDPTQRGQYGEGLKLALLALLRAGKRVRVYSGGKSYTPDLVFDSQLQCRVLAIKTGRAATITDRSQVIIENMTSDEWTQLRSRFTRWAGFTDTVDTHSGTLIRDESAKGMVFVKGIYVCTDENLQYGYDLKKCELDRDRCVPRQWDLEYETSRVLQYALSGGHVSGAKVLSLLESGSTESRSVGGAYCGDAVKKQLVDAVKDAHPDAEAYAYTASEAAEAPSGVSVVTLPSGLRETLQCYLPSVADAVSSDRKKPKRLLDPCEVSSDMSRVLDTLSSVSGFSLRFAEISENGHPVVLDPEDGPPFIDVSIVDVGDIVKSTAAALSAILSCQRSDDYTALVVEALLARPPMRGSAEWDGSAIDLLLD